VLTVHVPLPLAEKAELVNENETPPTTIWCSAGSLFTDKLLIYLKTLLPE
jgi:hypothetical protein